MSTEIIKAPTVLELKHDNNIKTSVYSKLYHLIHEGSKSFIELFDYFTEHEKIDINYEGYFWTSLLSFSIFMREEKIALYLIEKGADIRFIDSVGLTPLNYCVTKMNYEKSGFNHRENIEMTKLLIQLMCKGANLVHVNPLNGYFPSREAHLHGFNVSHQLINNKISTINKNPKKYPEQYKEIFDFMFNDNNLNVCPKQPVNIIDACHQKNENLALEMVKQDPQKCIEFIDDLNQNALHYAISNQMYSLSKKLILAGINYEQKSIANLSPIDLVFFYENEKDKIQMMKFLDGVFEKLDKNNIELAKEISLEDIRIEEKKKVEKIIIERKQKKEQIQQQKNQNLILKKKKLELKKQKKLEDKYQNRELRLMNFEDTMYIEKELRIKQKKEEYDRFFMELYKQEKKIKNIKLNQFFFDCEKNDDFWNKNVFDNQ